MSSSVDGLSDISSAKSGESNLKKKKKVAEKGTRINLKKKENIEGSDFEKSSIGSSMLDSDVSSTGLKE